MNITSDKITDYINGFYAPLDDDLAEFRKRNEEDRIPLILRETETFLSFLLMLVKPSRILEIGTAYGYSALFFAKKCPDARITTIDRNEHFIPVARENFDCRPEGGRIDLRIGDADAVLDSMIDEISEGSMTGDDSETSGGFGFDFVFIDAGKSHYREFFDRAERLCRPGAVIVCDNIFMRGWLVDRSYDGAKRHRTNVKYMRQFLEYINGRDDLTVSLLSSGDGLAVIKLNN